MIVFLAVLIAVLVALISGDIAAALVTYFWVLVIPPAIIYLVRKIYSRRFAGHIIKDYGKKSLWLLLASCSPVFILIFFLFPETLTAPFSWLPSPVSYFIAFLLCGFLSLLFLSGSISRVQLMENGINLYGFFVDWDWVKSYYWDYERNVLYLEGQNEIFNYVLPNQSVWIASNHREVVDKLLKKHIGTETPRQ